MAALFESLSCWHWLALALLLLMVEMAGAGGYLLWAGMSAGVTALLLWLVPGLSWQMQLVVFSVGAVIMALGWWQYQQRRPRVVPEPLLNQRSAQYVGRIFTLSDAIENGRGKIRVDDSFWEVSAAQDMPVGTRVRITAVEHDQIFCVEAV